MRLFKQDSPPYGVAMTIFHRLQNRSMRRCLFGISVAVIVAAAGIVHAQDRNSFDLEKFRRECGGRYFPTCNALSDLTGTNQWTLFKAAKEVAKRENKLILAIAGADWCAPCIIDFLAFTDTARGGQPAVVRLTNSRYVVLPVSVDKRGGRDVLNALSLPTGVLHSIAIYDPASERSLQTVIAPHTVFGLFSHVLRCELSEPMPGLRIALLREDRLFDARMEFLSNPAIPIASLIDARNAVAQQLCAQP